MITEISTILSIINPIKMIQDFRNRNAKLNIERFTYEINPGIVSARGYTTIGSNILLRNKSSKSTTLETVIITLNGKSLEPLYRRFKQLDISSNSSQDIYLEAMMKNDEFEKLIKSKDNKFCIELTHTFGTIKKQKFV